MKEYIIKTRKTTIQTFKYKISADSPVEAQQKARQLTLNASTRQAKTFKEDIDQVSLTVDGRTRNYDTDRWEK